MSAQRRPMKWRDIAPNFRIMGGFIEVPAGFQYSECPAELYSELKARVDSLLEAHKHNVVLDERSLDDHRAVTSGKKIPVPAWNHVMDQEIPGWYWGMEHGRPEQVS